MKANLLILFTIFLFICGVRLMQGQETGTVTDIDGNVYQTIKIGEQWWMAENLKVSRYRNGDNIPNVTNDSEWVNLTTGAWAYYNNDLSYGDTYGKLYNWYTVDDSRGICPEGWHVPSNQEWIALEDFLGGHAVAGGKMKSTSGWFQDGNGTNESGFSGLPGGGRNHENGQFSGMAGFGSWWSSTETYPDSAYRRQLRHYDTLVGRHPYSSKKLGVSIRCLKDDEKPSDQPSTLSPGNATAGVGISPRLRWLKSAHATTYNIQLTDNNGLNIDVDEISDTTFIASGLAYETEYEWRVRSWNIHGYSDWSATNSFTTIAPPERKEIKEAPAGVNQTVEYEESGLKFTATIQASADVTVEIYDQQPYSGDYPEGVVQTGDMYIYISGDEIEFGNGYLHIPINLLPQNVDTEILTIVKRDASGDPWEDIGGEVVDEYFVNTVPFDKLGEFTIGLLDDATSVDRDPDTLPIDIVLYQNYPNPFNPSTMIRFALPDGNKVILTAYNILGQEVMRLVDEHLSGGTYEFVFDASSLPGGVYIYRLQAGEYVESKKLLYLK